ncbi:MAG: TIR domain-containing protein [Chromatiaceae bacterium]|nr:TIR domain-containing protein [Chromatiaceae bacterium]MCP5423218.1 TIR domain-containing protein [Chromatiaceae bacterium]
MQDKARSKLFISYSRVDLAFANELVTALEQSADFQILIDRIGIGHGEAWRERLGRLIVECDTLLFVLSPDSVASEVCAWEIGEARRLSKRIIPVLWRAVDFAQIPDDLSAINAVPFDGAHAVSGLPKLIAAVNSDLDWLREHTRLGERALEWEQSGRAAAYLLRGAALASAQEWLAAKPANAPSPTQAQRDFVQASEQEQSRLLSDERKRLHELEKAKASAEAERDAAQQARASEARSARRVVRATTTGLIVAVVLLLAASGAGWFALQKAEDERKAAGREAEAARLAQQEADRAASANRRAEKERDDARLIQSRFLARAAREQLARGDVANALALARAALPNDLADPDRPFAIEAAQLLFDAYGRLRELATLRGHTGNVKGALEMPGGRIVTWGRDGTIRWWHPDGTLLKTVVAHVHPEQPGGQDDTGVHGVLRLDDGRLLSWGVDRTARLWRDDGDLIETFLENEAGHGFERLHDGRIGAIVGSEYRIWDATLELSLVLESPGPDLLGARQLSDGRFVTWTWQRGGPTTLWHVDGTPAADLSGHANTLRGAFELTDGSIVTFDNGPSLRIWSADGELKAVVEKAHRHVSTWEPFAFPLRDGRFFTWGQEAYHDHVWWARLWTAQGESVPLVEASDAPLQGLQLDDGRLLLGVNSQTPTIWQTDGKPGPALRGHEQRAYGAAQWRDGRIATHSADGTARVWSRNGAPLLTLRGHEAGVSGIASIGMERLLTWSSIDRTARVWSEQPRPRSVLRFEGGDAKHVQQLSNGSIAVLTNTGSIALFAADLTPGPVLRNERREIAELVELAPDQLITRGQNHSNRQSGPSLRLLNSEGEPVTDLAGPAAEFVYVARSPSGRIIGFERSGTVWSWHADGQVERVHAGAEDERLYQVTRLHDGRFVSLGHDGKHRLQLWSAEGEPGSIIRSDEALDATKQLLIHDDGHFSLIQHRGTVWTWDAGGRQLPALDLDDDLRVDSAVALRGGKLLLSHFGGDLSVVNTDRSVRHFRYPPGPDGRYRRHAIFTLADGRLLVSTAGQGTRLWSADGEPGEQILDRFVDGATLLADGSFAVWPADDDKTLQIVGPYGEPGPLLRGHDAAIKQVIQLGDGRILSRADDASVRVWPGSVEQAVAWADDVIARLQPLTFAERCEHYMELPAACAGDAER